MPNINKKALEAFRVLLLPIKEGGEAAALGAALITANRQGITEEDFPYYIIAESRNWLDSGKPTKVFSQISRAAISADKTSTSTLLSEKYYSAHVSLQEEFLMSHDQALAFLSHAQLIIFLTKEFQMSASQISIILSARDHRVPFCRPSVHKLLTLLRICPEMSINKINSIFQDDLLASELIYADAKLEDCEYIIDEMAQKLGIQKNFGYFLGVLAPRENLAQFTPYLQILHYQCSIAEVHDIAIKDLYEFSPRGKAALTLFEKYPDMLVGAGNPFLNNAKSVEQITQAWVRSKKSADKAGADALYKILDSLQSIGHSARKEICSRIRMWIHRIIIEASHNQISFPKCINERQVKKVVQSVCQGNTATSGVIEQRLVDSVSSVLHSDNKVWRPRGLLDSVNATNISRKKLGDCDFQNSAAKKVIAYEAHGGNLTQLYLDEHLRTLKKIIPYRTKEWSSFSDIKGWEVEIIFVAHKIAEEVKNVEEVIDDVKVLIRTVVFDDFLLSIPASKLTVAFEEYVLSPLSEKQVPEPIRKKFMAML